MGKVATLPQRAPEGDDLLPPFTIGIAINMSDSRQITINSPVTEPITPAEANRRTDLLMHVAERQRSKLEIRYHLEEIADKRTALALWEKRRDEAVAEHEKLQEKRTEEVSALMAKRRELEQRVAASWVSSGRTGVPALQGRDKNQDAAWARAIAAKLEEVSKGDAEHGQNVQTALGNIEKLSEEIAARERLVEKHREIVG